MFARALCQAHTTLKSATHKQVAFRNSHNETAPHNRAVLSACRKSWNKKLIIVNFYDTTKPSLEEIPLLGEMSRSDKRVAVFAEKGVTANAVTEGWKVR